MNKVSRFVLLTVVAHLIQVTFVQGSVLSQSHSGDTLPLTDINKKYYIKQNRQESGVPCDLNQAECVLSKGHLVNFFKNPANYKPVGHVGAISIKKINKIILDSQPAKLFDGVKLKVCSKAEDQEEECKEWDYKEDLTVDLNAGKYSFVLKATFAGQTEAIEIHKSGDDIVVYADPTSVLFTYHDNFIYEYEVSYGDAKPEFILDKGCAVYYLLSNTEKKMVDISDIPLSPYISSPEEAKEFVEDVANDVKKKVQKTVGGQTQTRQTTIFSLSCKSGKVHLIDTNKNDGQKRPFLVDNYGQVIPKSSTAENSIVYPGLSAGAIAGIVIGVLAILILIIVIIYYFGFARNR